MSRAVRSLSPSPAHPLRTPGWWEKQGYIFPGGHQPAPGSARSPDGTRGDFVAGPRRGEWHFEEYVPGGDDVRDRRGY